MTARNSFALGLAAGSLLALMAAVAGAQQTSCLPATVRPQGDTLVREANRPQGPRKSVVNRLGQRLLTICPAPVPVPVPPVDTVTPPPPVDTVPVPPGPTPPPAPITLAQPVSTAPGSTTAPGPVESLTPVFSWSAVPNATGYVVAVRSVTTGAFVYPSTTGVGVPISGTSLTLPSGVLAAGAAYKWDVTAVADSVKSLASADRYFTTAAIVTPPPPTGSTIAALPRSVPVVPAGLDQAACTVNVGSGQLQAALNAIVGGSVLCLTGTHTGSFTVSACPSTWAVVRSAVLPPAGRIRPSTATGLAKIVANGTGAMSALRFLSRSCKVLVLGVEITTVATAIDGPTALVEVGSGSETALTDLPTDIAFQAVYIHGWPQQRVRRAFALNGGAQTVVNSWCSELHDNADSQCVISWNGSGPILIADNYLEAASENIMLGGADSRIPGVVVSDVTIRRNHIAKPLSWKGAGWNVKNLIESKVGARVLIADNVLDGSWLDGQTGYAFVIKSTNQQGTCRWCSSSDWTVRRNLVRNVGAGITISGRGDNTATDSSNRRMVFEDNWFEPVNVGQYVGDARLWLFGPDNRDIVVRRNVFEGGAVNTAVLFAATTTWNIDITGNVLPVGAYGLFTGGSSPGLASWNAGPQPVKTWANAMIGSSGGVAYPAGTVWYPDLNTALAATGLSKSAVLQATAGVVVPP